MDKEKFNLSVPIDKMLNAAIQREVIMLQLKRADVVRMALRKYYGLDKKVLA